MFSFSDCCLKPRVSVLESYMPRVAPGGHCVKKMALHSPRLTGAAVFQAQAWRRLLTVRQTSGQIQREVGINVQSCHLKLRLTQSADESVQAMITFKGSREIKC